MHAMISKIKDLSAINRHRGGQTRIFSAISLIVLAAGLLGIGCNDAPIVWRAEVASPDGRWIAVALTRQGGGFGTAYINTTVSLKSIHLSNAPQTVFGVLL